MPGLLISSEKDLRGTMEAEKVSSGYGRAPRPAGARSLNEKSPAHGQAFSDIESGKDAQPVRIHLPELTTVTSLPTSGNVNLPPTAFTPFTRHSQV